MDLNTDVPAVTIVQERANTRLNGAVLAVMRVRDRRLLAKFETHQGRGRRSNNLVMQVRRRAFDKPGHVSGTSRRLTSDRCLYRQRPFIDEEPKPHDLRDEQDRHNKKRDLRAKPHARQLSSSTSQFRQ